MKNPIHFGTDLRVKLSYKCFPFFSLSGCHVLTIENCRVEFLPHLEKTAPTLLNARWTTINCICFQSQRFDTPSTKLYRVVTKQHELTVSFGYKWPRGVHYVSRKGKVNSSSHCSLSAKNSYPQLVQNAVNDSDKCAVMAKPFMPQCTPHDC